VLGLRLVKQTVNFDAPDTYHLYFGDELGRPGTLLTFFEWSHAPHGRPGIGGTQSVALYVASYDALRMWHRRLSDIGVIVEGLVAQYPFTALRFRDPDGLVIRLVVADPGWPAAASQTQAEATKLPKESWPEAVDAITPEMSLRRGMSHITAISSNIERTHAFYGDLLGLQRIRIPSDADAAVQETWWYWGRWNGADAPGPMVAYAQRDAAQEGHARIGVGQTHHFALAVADQAEQLAWRERLVSAGLRVTPVLDRVYFTSIYTNDPDGHIVELATVGPGFAVDETQKELGRRLQLPPWLAGQRTEIEAILTPLNTLD
jgi:glyoxalase family protein